MKKLLVSLVAAFAVLASCTKDNSTKDTVPFAGQWVAADDPVHVVLKSEEGKVNVPGVGEADDETVTFILKQLLASEFSTDGMTVTVSENKDSDENVHIVFVYEGETLTADGKYADGMLVTEMDGRWFDGTEEKHTVKLHVMQKTEDDLTIYMDKQQILAVISEDGPALLGSESDGDDFDATAYYEKIEIGINLVRER